jgi:hypothetical protein
LRALEALLGPLGACGRRADAAENNGGPVDQVAVVDVQLHRGAGDGEVAMPVAVYSTKA